jgi:hypothetical protein
MNTLPSSMATAREVAARAALMKALMAACEEKSFSGEL